MINKEISDKVIEDLVIFIKDNQKELQYKRERADIRGQLKYTFNYKDADVEIFEGCIYINDIMVFGGTKNKLFPILESLYTERSNEIRRIAEQENTKEIKRIFGYD